MATDTVSAYLTAYDEDWYSFSIGGGTDWTIATHATTADDNVGDTKLYLYAGTSDVNAIASSTGSGYSSISHRFEDADTTYGLTVASDVVFTGEFGGATDDNAGTYTFPTGAEAWAGFANENTDIYPFSFPDGGTISFTGATAGTDVDVYFRFEYNPYPDTEPSYNTDTVTVSGTAEASYSVAIPAQGTNTFSSFLLYVTTPDAAVTLTNVDVSSNTSATYYIKVVPYSNSYAGAYLLTASSASLPDAYGKVVINEIHYNPATSQGSDNDYEFLELYNTSASDVDLHGMTVGQVGSTTSIASLDSVTIGAGSYVVVAYTGATYSSLTVPVVDNDGYFGLSNSGKALELIDSTGALVDNVTYDDYAPWPNYTGPDGGGPSLELIDASADNNVASNWRGWGLTGGTPGAANSAQPDLSMGASITSYQPVATSAAGTFQLNNNGDADLTVSSITVDSTYVPGSGTDYSMADVTNSGSSAATTATVSGGPSTIGGATLVLTWVGSSWTSEASATLTSPTGTVV
ncbi:MAG TPA: lamin tail domain-containing protein, partial [Arenicellales bacterium]|nr:lamin tail domain-containing protein [Arenicellales bacterium]